MRNSCWDGKNLDSADHKSHISYPASGTMESGGPCPASHPVKIPQVMYEVMWDTRQFVDKALWPENPKEQPLVWSSGDKSEIPVATSIPLSPTDARNLGLA